MAAQTSCKSSPEESSAPLSLPWAPGIHVVHIQAKAFTNINLFLFCFFSKTGDRVSLCVALEVALVDQTGPELRDPPVSAF